MRVLIVDDSALVRAGLSALIGLQRDLEVCGCAPDGREGIAMALSTAPDVVVMDLWMPTLDGYQATRQIRRLCPRAGVVVLTADPAPASERAAREAGAGRFVLKGAPPEVLLTAIRELGAGPRLSAQRRPA